MKKNELLKCDNSIFRILDITTDKVLILDCTKVSMPKWVPVDEINDFDIYSEEALREALGFEIKDISVINKNHIPIMHKRFTIIACLLPFIGDISMRSMIMKRIAEENNISKQTVRAYLHHYLVFMDIQALLPKERDNKGLTQDEKNMRWALNKFFYNHNKNTLNTAYTLMLKEKYCDESGLLCEKYPTFYQFRYFYRKTRKLQNYYISRNGLTNYQRNNRPCVGNGVQDYAPVPGIAMVDATICDIYLVDEDGKLVGRPVLTVCIDAYSSFCYGYSLSWDIKATPHN